MTGVRLTNTSDSGVFLEGGQVIPVGGHLDLVEGDESDLRVLADVRHHYEAGRLSAGEIPQPKVKAIELPEPAEDFSDLIDEDPPESVPEVEAPAPARDPEP
jgi:hypothetical protein